MTTESQADVVAEARALLTPLVGELPTDTGTIRHALFADAVERQNESPFFGYSADMALFYARAPELISRLCSEVEALRTIVIAMSEALKLGVTKQ